jgi:transcriptional regulator
MAGCSTCISDVEKYFIENVKNDKTTLLILTAFASKRSLTMSFGQEALEVSNALIDSDNLFNSGTFLSLYPKFIYLEDKIISRIEEVSPNNLDALSNYINSVK